MQLQLQWMTENNITIIFSITTEERMGLTLRLPDQHRCRVQVFIRVSSVPSANLPTSITDIIQKLFLWCSPVLGWTIKSTAAGKALAGLSLSPGGDRGMLRWCWCCVCSRARDRTGEHAHARARLESRRGRAGARWRQVPRNESPVQGK